MVVTSHYSFGADFSTFWQAGHALFIRGINPYDSSVTETIQYGIYGRLATSFEDQVGYVYPPFSLLAVLPTAWMSYPWAQSYWMAFNLVLLFIGIKVATKKPPLWLFASVIFFYPVSRGIILGQFSLMIGAMLLIAYALLCRENPSNLQQWMAGGLLAWCSMKPQLVILILGFFLLVVIQRKLWRAFIGFFAGAVFLLGISWIFVPTWFTDWIKLITAYVGYVPIQPILGEWLKGVGLNWSATWLTITLLIIGISGTIFLVLGWWKKKVPDYALIGWLFLIGQLVEPNPYSLASDQIVFLLPLVLWITNGKGQIWFKEIIWGLFVVLPWLFFMLNFQGKEPYAVASGLAMIFFLWWMIVLLIQPVRILKKTI